MNKPLPKPLIDIEVVYALPDEQTVIELAIANDATVYDAILASGLLERKFTDPTLNIVVDDTPVGIYGERVTYQDQLQNGDRIEIYRPLQLDPMQARHARAKAQQKVKGKKPGKEKPTAKKP